MPPIDLEQVEAKLRAAKRRSQRRFVLFLLLILGIWGATYLYTKGEFTLFTKKIAVTDTIVVDQTAAIQARDQMIADQAKLIALLEDSIKKVSSRLPQRTEPAKNVEAERLARQIRLREIERRRRDSILYSRKQEYIKQYPVELEQSSIKNIQSLPPK